MDEHKTKSMEKFRRAVMWAGLAVIILLTFLSIYGAFIGSEKAKSFFSSLPLGVYWAIFAALLIIGVNVFRRLMRVPGLLLMHAGCIFILAGSMWASEAGHKFQKKLFGIDKIVKGQMRLYEGYSDNHVITESGLIKELPFQIGLRDFQIEYYEPAYLYIQSREGQLWKIPAEIGSEFSLGPELGTVAIVRTFENFKITIDGENRTAVDEAGSGSNPAVEVRFTSPEGDVTTKYVFERFPGHVSAEDKFLLSYGRVIREYISQLQISQDGKIVCEKDIEVNHPLRFGGYHIYQHDYDHEAQQYTELTVVSDAGLPLVYIGYWMLCIGVIWHMWLRHVLAGIKTKKQKDGN